MPRGMRAEVCVVPQRFTAAPSTGEPLAPCTPSGIPAIPAGKEKRCQRFRGGGHRPKPHAMFRETGTKISAPGRPRLQPWGRFGHHNIKKDVKLLESVQRRAMGMEKGLERPWEERLRALGVFSWIQGREGESVAGVDDVGAPSPAVGTGTSQIWFFRFWCSAFPSGKHRIPFPPKQYLEGTARSQIWNKTLDTLRKCATGSGSALPPLKHPFKKISEETLKFCAWNSLILKEQRQWDVNSQTLIPTASPNKTITNSLLFQKISWRI